MYTINEVADILKVTTKTIVFYEKKGLLPAKKGLNKHKKYTLNDIITLQSILLYRSMGLSFDSISVLLIKNKNKQCLSIYQNQLQLVNSEVERLGNIKMSLESLIGNINNQNIDTYTDNKNFINALDKSNIANSIGARKKGITKKQKKSKKKGGVIKSIIFLSVCFCIFKLVQINKEDLVGIIKKKLLSNKTETTEVAKKSVSNYKVNEKNKLTANESQTNIIKEREEEESKLQNKRAKIDSPYLIISNKQKPIGPNYVPADLRVPNVAFQGVGNEMVKYMQAEAATALEKLFNEAASQGINLIGVSGYRSYDYQVTIYNNEVYNQGEAEAFKYVAQPGESEHQLGLSMDVLSNEYGSLDEGFENTESFKWLIENMSRFGFILRYPKGKEEITGYGYEPWHLRYVGINPATEIMSRNITLEEYMN